MQYHWSLLYCPPLVTGRLRSTMKVKVRAVNSRQLQGHFEAIQRSFVGQEVMGGHPTIVAARVNPCH